MKRFVNVQRVIGGLALAGLVVVATRATLAQRETAPVATREARVARGEKLVWSIGCNDCHTPKKMGVHGPELDTARLLSGHRHDAKLPAPPSLPAGPWAVVVNWESTAWSGPWGVSYTFNLTPDVNTGIGIWTEDMFIKALRTGRHMGVSRQILPPMPWDVYGRLSDEDLRSIYAYLRTIPPVSNLVPEPVIADSEKEHKS